MPKIYTGVGSRQTPPGICKLMVLIAGLYAARGWTLRSGGADGADLAFESGCDLANGVKEVYLPWARFNGNTSRLTSPITTETLSAVADDEYGHPIFRGKSPRQLRELLRSGSKQGAILKLMCRNAMQVWGGQMHTPAAKLICWTRDGCSCHEERSEATGGTGQAISFATMGGIPVDNLALPEVRERYENVLIENGVSL